MTASPHRWPRALLATALLGATTGAAAWTSGLPDGAEIRVDPDTHRAWRVQGEQAVPMWDGVHRLEDGSVVIIREGTAVPSEAMLDAWQRDGPEQEDRGADPCRQLEDRVCGRHLDCRETAACLQARSLANRAREAARRLPYGAGAPEAELTACREALADPAFPACHVGSPGDSIPSPCNTLVERVCGADGRCATAPACPPARQLLEQDREERATAADPGALTPSGAQCREALGNDFFAPCE